MKEFRLEDVPYLPDQLCPHNRKLRHWCRDCREAADLKKVSIRQLHDPQGRTNEYTGEYYAL